MVFFYSNRIFLLREGSKGGCDRTAVKPAALQLSEGQRGRHCPGPPSPPAWCSLPLCGSLQRRVQLAAHFSVPEPNVATPSPPLLEPLQEIHVPMHQWPGPMCLAGGMTLSTSNSFGISSPLQYTSQNTHFFMQRLVGKTALRQLFNFCNDNYTSIYHIS